MLFRRDWRRVRRFGDANDAIGDANDSLVVCNYISEPKSRLRHQSRRSRCQLHRSRRKLRRSRRKSVAPVARIAKALSNRAFDGKYDLKRHENTVHTVRVTKASFASPIPSFASPIALFASPIASFASPKRRSRRQSRRKSVVHVANCVVRVSKASFASPIAPFASPITSFASQKHRSRHQLHRSHRKSVVSVERIAKASSDRAFDRKYDLKSHENTVHAQFKASNLETDENEDSEIDEDDSEMKLITILPFRTESMTLSYSLPYMYSHFGLITILPFRSY